MSTHRIVSLCPSTTLTLYDLGLADSVVGRTRYCQDHPNSGATETIRKVGGTKDPKWDVIADLQPTHILFNMEENDYTQLPKAQAICETLVDTPINVQESKDLVLSLGKTFDAVENAESIAKSIDNAAKALQNLPKQSFTYLYFIWHTPKQRVAGTGTYIEAMLNAAGGQNLARMISDDRYPLVPADFEEIADYCLLSTEPFHFKASHIPQYTKFGRAVRIIDGEQISWHGSKTVQGLEYLAEFFQTP